MGTNRENFWKSVNVSANDVILKPISNILTVLWRKKVFLRQPIDQFVYINIYLFPANRLCKKICKFYMITVPWKEALKDQTTLWCHLWYEKTILIQLIRIIKDLWIISLQQFFWTEHSELQTTTDSFIKKSYKATLL